MNQIAEEHYLAALWFEQIMKSTDATRARTTYNHEFFCQLRSSSRQSAKVIAPQVIELLRPKSVVDVGCGTGTWLSAFHDQGVTDIFGVDGAWVTPEMLEIPSDRFMSIDAATAVRLHRMFDLVVSLEVGEHLKETQAKAFVESLTNLGPVTLFSAAIPFQGGTHHVNEQWPEYWADLFIEAGYAPIDCFRNAVWDNEDVAWWYAQNILLFVQAEYLKSHPQLRKLAERTAPTNLSRIHPGNSLTQKALCAIEGLRSHVPAKATVIVVDEEQYRDMLGTGHRTVPFLERKGSYWGKPEDDDTAICELERLRREGAEYLVILWPAFWWLEHYHQWREYLYGKCRCLVASDSIIAFQLSE